MPRTSFRRPGCGGRTSTWNRCATSAPTWFASRPGWRSIGCAPRSDAGRCMSANGCPSPSARSRMWPTMSISPKASRWRSCSFLKRCRRRSARCSSCGRRSTSATTKSPPPSTRVPVPFARSRTALAGTSRLVALARWSPGMKRGRRWSR